MSWIERLTAPWTDRVVLDRIDRKIDELGASVADLSTLLNDIAAGLSGPLAGSVQELIARNAELEGVSAGNSAAAQNVRTAFDDLAAKFTNDPEAPDVAPLPETGSETGPADPENTPA